MKLTIILTLCVLSLMHYSIFSYTDDYNDHCKGIIENLDISIEECKLIITS